MSHSKVTKVRVFIDRAEITREQTVSVADLQNNEVLLTGIPLQIDRASLRARATLGTEKVRVIGVRSSVVYSEPPKGRSEEIASALEKLDGKLAGMQISTNNEKHLNDLLTRYASITTSTLSHEWLERDPSFDKWEVAFDELRRTKTKFSRNAAKREMVRDEILSKKADLLEEDNRRGRAEALGHAVTVELDLPKEADGELHLSLTYLTSEAQWMPIYDVRVEASAMLIASALVRQSTGEDWQDVELVATTARPPLSEPPPDLQRIGVRGTHGSEKKEVVSETSYEHRLNGAAGQVAETNETAVEHRAPGLVSIPSTKKPVLVELFRGNLPCRTRLEVAPDGDRPRAIWVAEARNETGRVLLPGKVNLFRDAGYSGQTQLGFILPGERFRLPLGTEGSVQIKRELKAHPETQKMVTGSVVHQFDCRWTLSNRSSKQIDLVVRDRIPTSDTDTAKVKVLRMPKGMELDQETGLSTIFIALAPAEEQAHLASYSITAPRGFVVRPPDAI